MRELRVNMIMSLDGYTAGPVPVFLGGGARLFDNLGEARPRLEQIQVVEAPGVTHIRYRRKGDA